MAVERIKTDIFGNKTGEMFGSYIKTPYICTRNRGNSSVGRA